ncbi:hypothetical protein WA026_013414 [Henosepilachna vigintioctopunctata]|uniref:Regulator of G-protein signaling loco n=1 Tax=Henosepilachna vigintioctopunctata TaxID=420089 RepID=A0AAW1VER9_9CUCU
MLFKNRDGHGEGLSMAFGPQFKRFNNSLRRGTRRFSTMRRPSSVMSNTDLNQNDTDGPTSKDDSQQNSAQGWATSFEKLLEDPSGVKAFAEFLKKEFSSENIDFWTSVERFRRMPDGPERRAEARRIYQQHVCVGAHEAVNVDAHGRQCAEQALHEAPNHIFDQAQKQVLNLMKFDSYPRFLKSDLYKQCLSNSSKSAIATPIKLKKSLSNAEDRRRKSLLPWHRKTRSKSKDRPTNGETTPASVIVDSGCRRNEIHSSKSSLTSLDLAMANNFQNQKDDPDAFAGTVLCRVSLGNCSTTVVQIKQSESVQELVQRLLEKRGLNYNSFEVYTDRQSKPVDVTERSTILAGCEVRIQQRVVFKLDLPNRKTVSVKSKATKMIVDVLKPILHKYDFTVDQVVVVNPRDGAVEVDIRKPITTIDGLKLLVQLIDKRKNELPEPRLTNTVKANKLVEITNQVFEGILQEKAENAHVKTKSDKGSVKSDDLGSEHSSSYFSKLLRRDSGQQDWKKRSLIPRSRLLTNAVNKIAVTTPETPPPQQQQQNQLQAPKNRPLIAKWKAGANKLQVSPCSETECNELVEGLTRAQKSRLEDQRGTEINFELPDFLKDKENDRKLRRSPLQSTEDSGNRPFSNGVDNGTAKTIKLDSRSDYENQNIRPDMPKNDASPLNTPSKQMKLTNTSDFPASEGVVFKSSHFAKQKSPTDKKDLRMEPPPLPPKPKIVPSKPPNWGHNEFGRLKDVSQSIKSKQSLFLEQPSSSFV